MSESTREKAREVKEQLYWSKFHSDRAKELSRGFPDKELQRKVDDASQKAGEAYEHAKRGLEQK